ncbi:DUF5698 domain-containing protein [Desulfonispora thiosulfatigenes]|uniref:DUF5698 domain-containing protein n=1 Tax=Desulfonispora thiosulfatigenes TaxID=83661 RepID=UPI000A05AE4A|nr:DUF5698 domain-containing protein [Desulfonispora thiosulfatigenes]
MTKEVILALVGLFLITSFTNILATLKTMLISKKIMNPVYFVVFLDALIFATVVTKVTSSVGFHYTVAYGLGRTAGVYIGSKLEERLALGILEVDIFFNNKSKMTSVAESLREEGYTVNNYLASGYHEDVRYKVEVVIKRKEFKVLEKILDECGVQNPTLKIKNLSKVEGKITTTRTQMT